MNGDWVLSRLINHGLYGGAAGFAGTLLAGLFLGRQYAVAGFIIMIFVIAGAGLWAQFVEGSPRLLRPFGYYGGGDRSHIRMPVSVLNIPC